MTSKHNYHANTVVSAVRYIYFQLFGEKWLWENSKLAKKALINLALGNSIRILRFYTFFPRKRSPLLPGHFMWRGFLSIVILRGSNCVTDCRSRYIGGGKNTVFMRCKTSQFQSVFSLPHFWPPSTLNNYFRKFLCYQVLCISIPSNSFVENKSNLTMTYWAILSLTQQTLCVRSDVNDWRLLTILRCLPHAAGCLRRDRVSFRMTVVWSRPKYIDSDATHCTLWTTFRVMSF